MNAAIRAVTRRAVWQSSEVFGARHGYAGFIRDNFTPLTPRDLGRISHLAGTMPGAHAVRSFALSAESPKLLQVLKLNRHIKKIEP
jgi:6-phosphofructokinase 1